ncbi:MAG: ribonuclease HII [Candidatus Micrarchaeota archaeon]
MAFIAGVDEAGRGPVLGPLVICAFACREGEEKTLRELGAKDSKALQPPAREKAAAKLKGYPHSMVEISAEEITEAMRSKVSLNELEARKAADALAKLQRKLGAEKLATVFIDSPDPNPRKFEQRIKKYWHKLRLPAGAAVIAENHADSKYAVVGAASVMAKSLREKRVGELHKEFGFFGSGYPSDERTMEFLRRHVGDGRLKRHIRWEWSTLNKISKIDVRLSDFT